MAGPLPYRQEWQKDWLSSTPVRTLSLAAKGLLTEIKAYQWEEGHVPADPVAVAKMVGGDTREFRAAWREVRPLMDEDGPGRLVYRPLAAQREAVIEKVGRLAQNGSKGGSAKKAKAEAIATPKATANDEQTGSKEVAKPEPVTSNHKPELPSGSGAAAPIPLRSGWEPLGDWLDLPDLRAELREVEGRRSPEILAANRAKVEAVRSALEASGVGPEGLVAVLRHPEARGWRGVEPEGVIRVLRLVQAEPSRAPDPGAIPEAEDPDDVARRRAAMIAAIEAESEDLGLGGGRP